jgi:hypothetical protein
MSLLKQDANEKLNKNINNEILNFYENIRCTCVNGKQQIF